MAGAARRLRRVAAAAGLRVSPGLHIDPPAPWMNAEALAPGGDVDRLAAGFTRQYAGRALEVWRTDLQRFAGSAPITSTLMEAHARQSAAHWALRRAAALALADARYGVRREPDDVQQPAAARPPSAAAEVGRAFGWGQQTARRFPWGRR